MPQTRICQPMLSSAGQLSPGPHGRIAWSTMLATERLDAWGDWSFTVEPAQGWPPFSWLVTINDHPYLVDGDTPPSDPGLDA